MRQGKKMLLLEAPVNVHDIEHTLPLPALLDHANAKPLNVYWFVLPELFGLGTCSRMLLFGGGWYTILRVFSGAHLYLL